MRRKAVLIAASLVASVAGAFAGVDLSQASRVTTCSIDPVGRALTSGTALGTGMGIPAVVAGRAVVVVGRDGAREAFLPAAADDGVVRHASSRPGSGTAFVLDRRGADVVVIETGRDEVRLPQPTEATDPSWSSDGRVVWSLGSRLRLWSPATRSTIDIAPPADALGVFSPVFAANDAIVSVVAEPERGFTRTEDEGLDNLWRYELGSRRWSRVTAFHAAGDRWVAVRTPIVRDDGSIEFVLVRGRASANEMPSFELWRMSAGGVPSTVRELPREMYLAGVLDGRRVWNVFDGSIGEWRLYSEASATTLVDLGCGATLVDPRSVPDPDMTPARLDSTPTPSPTTDPTPTGQPTPPPGTAIASTAGILVGDFASPQDADAALQAIQGAFGESTPAEVVSNATEPNIVRPGVWAVVMSVPDGTDPLAALDDLRSRLPEYRDWSWVVST